jgi:DNA polymerase III epsilon subunit family exonuclease
MKELFELPLAEVPVVVIDTETTGLSPQTGDRVVEIGAVRFAPGSTGPWQLEGEFDQLIYPGRRMDPKASRVNQIYDADLSGKPTFSMVADELMDLLSGALIIAHNASFNADFIGMELYIDNLNRSGEGRHKLTHPWLCTMQLARRQFRFGRNNLARVARALGVRAGRAHRALDDARTTAEVARRMARRLARNRIVLVGDLLRAQGGAIYAPTMEPVILPSPLSEALIHKLPLRIRYDDYGGTSMHIFHPRYATSSLGRKYIIGHSQELRDQCALRVDRILSAELMSQAGDR